MDHASRGLIEFGRFAAELADGEVLGEADAVDERADYLRYACN
jgi:hypothetical protein